MGEQNRRYQAADVLDGSSHWTQNLDEVGRALFSSVLSKNSCLRPTGFSDNPINLNVTQTYAGPNSCQSVAFQSIAAGPWNDGLPKYHTLNSARSSIVQCGGCEVVFEQQALPSTR